MTQAPETGEAGGRDARVGRIVLVASSPLAIGFLAAQVEALSHHYEVWIAVNVVAQEAVVWPRDAARIVPVRLERRPAPLRDLAALWALCRLFRRVRPALVHSFTSKAGLVGMAAAYATRVPVRVHTFTGQSWVTRRGWSRRLLKAADRAIATLATQLFVDSHSQRKFLLKEGIVKADKSCVLGDGTLGGVDTRRFAPDPVERKATRAHLGIPHDGVMFLFVGRATFDKGVIELAKAFRRVSASLPDAYLVVVGPDEDGILGLRDLQGQERITVVGPSLEPERFMKAADVLCLPSKREGFGFVIIEAASTGVPAIASRIYGITDAVVDRETGVLFECNNVDELVDRMIEVATRPAWRRSLGEAARRRALIRYPQSRLTAELLGAYERMLRQRVRG